MLTVEQQYVLDLLRHALNGRDQPDAPVGIDASSVASIILNSGVLPTVYPSLASCSSLKQRLATNYYAQVSQIVNQNHEGELVLKAIGAAGLDCMGLKGWSVRHLYPYQAMRQMADLDVLVRPYRFDVIAHALGPLGYFTSQPESSDKHEGFHKGVVTIETHKRLTNDVGPIQEWEARVWGHAQQLGGHVYRMADEDVYIHHFVHMHWDFLNGWFGLRRIVDAWLLNQQRDTFDDIYVSRELRAMGVERFCDRMCQLGRVCMGEEPIDDDMELLLQYAFDCGLYGTDRSYKAGRIARLTHGGLASGKVLSALAAVLPPFSRMRAEFPVLDCWPVLLPACWARRIVHILRHWDLQREVWRLDYSDVSQEDIDYARQMHEVGWC